jgi:hypothetical protein
MTMAPAQSAAGLTAVIETPPGSCPETAAQFLSGTLSRDRIEGFDGLDTLPGPWAPRAGT